MAELPNEMRLKIRRGLARWWSARWTSLGAMSKADLKAAIDATDTWLNNNAASYVAALPEPARTELTSTQKTTVFLAVALARVSEGVLRQIFGEVD